MQQMRKRLRPKGRLAPNRALGAPHRVIGHLTTPIGSGATAVCVEGEFVFDVVQS